RDDQPRRSFRRPGRNSAAPRHARGSAARYQDQSTTPGRRRPAVGVGVARRSDVRPYPASRAVAADHVEELMRGEMRQLVKTDQGDLSALPIIDGAVELAEST